MATTSHPKHGTDHPEKTSDASLESGVDVVRLTHPFVDADL